MILTKNVQIKVNNSQIKNLNSKGLDVKIGDVMIIPTEYLSNGSRLLIDVKCDNCGVEKEMKYQTYNRITKNNTERYYCNNKECINKKREIAIKEKYGVKNIFQVKEIKGKIKETNLNKYGVENPQQNKEIKNKTEETNLEKYGFRNVFQNEKIKHKIKETNLEKYGVEYPMQSKEIRANFQNYNVSKEELNLINFISNNYNKNIIKSTKKIITGYELDIYLPELNLAFEFNGIYWHNEITKHRNYHKMKSDLCEEKRIQLIHIWEDDWNFKQDIIKSMILNKLGKTKNKIFARKTEVREISDNKMIRNFLNENHIQGFVGSSVKICLFYENELVSLMTFKKIKDTYELNRFCNKIDTNIIGGANKLFKYFIKNYSFDSITTFADKSYSYGNLYYKMGFKKIKELLPDYSYTINNNKLRSHKFNFRKHKLVKDGFDLNKSEHEIMLERKIYRIYDAGKIKFEFK